jgi:TPR repeat protein
VKPRFYGRVRVLCIGVENYKNRAIGQAKYSINDAQKLGELLTKVYGFDVEYLTGEHATHKAIKAKLKELCDGVTRKDALIVFFAGHGIVFDSGPESRHGYFIPYDANVNLATPGDTPLARWEADCLNMGRLVKQVETCKAHHAVLIADACCSGYMARRGSLENNIDLRLLLKGQGRTALAATTENQGARWFVDKETKIGHGVFTHALIEALNVYKREAASITDVFVALRKVIPGKTDGGMLPLMQPLGKGHGEFVFLPLFLTEAEVKIVEAELAGERGRSEYTRGLAERLLDRAKLRATPRDVFEAARAFQCHYDFSDDPATAEAAWKKRVERFTKSATLGDPLAMAALHYCHAYKLGVETKDEKLALHYARLAHATEHPAGLHVMARCYLLEIGGLSKNARAYARLTDLAAKENFPISLFNLGLGYEAAGKTRAADEPFELAVKGGYHVARTKAYWGRLYAAAVKADQEANEARGYAIMKEAYQDAARFLAEGARAGCALCAYELASLHAKHPEFLDRKKAVDYLKQAARAGYGMAQAVLARELARDWWMNEKDQPLDLGLEQDHREAFSWAELAARQNNADAHLVLANLYRFGSEAAKVRADLAEAKKHCLRAAELKHPCATVLKSYWHLKGIVFSKKLDPDAAFALAVEAAATKDNRALLWMGDLYWNHWVPVERLPRADKLPNGEWVMKHHALYYYTRAATGSKGEVSPYFGLQTARDHLRKINKDLRPEYLERFRAVYPKEARLFTELILPHRAGQWEGSETLAGFGKLSFTMLPKGKAVMDDARESTEGSWRQEGDQFTLTFGGRVVYTGTLQGGTLSGTASNGKAKWNWTVRARWEGSETLAGFGKLSFTMLPKGKAIMDDAKGRSEGTWRQNGDQFTLRFGGVIVYSGSLRGGTLSGTATNGRAKWHWTVRARPAR